MVDQNIINYLSEGLQNGYDLGSLRQRLLEAGYDDSQINEAINEVNQVSKFHSESPQKKSGSKKMVIIGVVIFVIVLAGAYFVFQFFSSDSDIITQEDEEVVEPQTQEVVDCGEMPPGFATEDEDYFQEHPEIDDKLKCISNNFENCNPSKINYLTQISETSVVDSFFSIDGVVGDYCVIRYKSRGKGLSCNYSLDQINIIRLAAAETLDKPWLDAFTVSFGMAFELIKYSPGETYDKVMVDERNGDESTVPCEAYSYPYDKTKGGTVCASKTCSDLGKECGNWDNGCSGTAFCGSCLEGENCIDGQCAVQSTCLDSDGGKDQYVKGGLSKGGKISTDSCVIMGGNTMKVGADCPSDEYPDTSMCYVREKFCENDEFKSEDINCPNGCVDDACIR